MFEFIKSISDIDNQLNNAPLYYNKALEVGGIEYWIQYQHLSIKNTETYSLEGVISGIATVQLISKNDDDSYSIYKYNGTLTIDRRLENNCIHDTIENKEELVSDIREYFK